MSARDLAYHEVSLRARMPALAKWLIAASVVVALGFGVLFVSILLDMRSSDLRQASQSAANLVATIEADIARNIEIYDLSLQAVSDGMKLPEINRVTKSIRQLILFDHAASAHDLGPLVVLDTQGKVTISSLTVDPEPEDLSAYDFFKVHKERSDAGLFIGKPLVARNGVHLVGISRRLSNPDGTFAGVVAGAIKLSYFHDLFRKVTVGEQSAILLMRTDGIVVIRQPFDLNSIGRDLSQAEVFRTVSANFAQNPIGWTEGTASSDGLPRLFQYHVIAGYPLVVVVATAIDEIYAGWRDKAWRIGVMVLALCVATVVLSILLAFALKRRQLAERELEVLARTDSLSCIANRRWFDAILEHEWRRAAREHTAIALLMIDADHFKEYNDGEGHQAGDDAIKLIAGCIERHGRRPGDLAARYGGEEFALLIAHASLDSAFDIAEAIRRDVLGLQAGQPSTFPTVSVGVACMIPNAATQSSELIDAADAALYAAKRNGRNRTERAELAVEPGERDAAKAA